MAKKTNLAAALAVNNKQAEEPEKPLQAVDQPKPEPRPKQQGRQGKSNIAGWFPMPVKLTLDELRLKRQRELGRNVTMQELMGEAYNDLFKKYGLPEVAPTRDGK